MSDRSYPPLVKVVFLLACLEAILIGIYGLSLVVVDIFTGEVPLIHAIVLGVFFVLIGAVILYSGRLIMRGRPSGRSLLLVWQLFILIIGVQTAAGGQMFVGLPAALIAGTTIVLLFSSSMNSHLLPPGYR